MVRNDQFFPEGSFCERNAAVEKLPHVYSCPFLAGTLPPASLRRLPGRTGRGRACGPSRALSTL